MRKFFDTILSIIIVPAFFAFGIFLSAVLLLGIAWIIHMIFPLTFFESAIICTLVFLPLIYAFVTTKNKFNIPLSSVDDFDSEDIFIEKNNRWKNNHRKRKHQRI